MKHVTTIHKRYKNYSTNRKFKYLRLKIKIINYTCGTISWWWTIKGAIGSRWTFASKRFVYGVLARASTTTIVSFFTWSRNFGQLRSRTEETWEKNCAIHFTKFDLLFSFYCNLRHFQNFNDNACIELIDEYQKFTPRSVSKNALITDEELRNISILRDHFWKVIFTRIFYKFRI